MSGNRTLTVTFAGDTGDLEKASKKATGALEDVEKASGDVGETFGNTASLTSQIAGGFGDLGGAIGQLPGPLGALGSGMETIAPSIMGITGAADLAEAAFKSFNLENIKTAAQTALTTVKTAALTVVTAAQTAATSALEAAQWLLNAAMSANPIGIVIGLLVLLTAAVIALWLKSETFRNIITGAFNAVLDVVKKVWNWVSDNWPLLLAIITGPIGLAVLAITKNWDTIKKGVTAVYEWIKQKFDDVVTFVTGLPAKIETAAAGMWDGIKTAFKTVINWIIDAWNGLDFKIPGFKLGPIHFPGFTLGLPDIPKLASGGIVSRPTLALIGEAGPEAVVPLSGRGGFGGVVNLTVNVPPTANPAETGRVVAGVLRSYFAAGGRLTVPT